MFRLNATIGEGGAVARGCLPHAPRSPGGGSHSDSPEEATAFDAVRIEEDDPLRVGRFHPEHVVGVHVTQLFSFPGDPAEFAKLSEKDTEALKFLEFFSNEKIAFNTLHSTQPQNLAYALVDSPVGQLAWSGQLFGYAGDRDDILDNVMVHWLTGTGGSALRIRVSKQQAVMERCAIAR